MRKKSIDQNQMIRIWTMICVRVFFIILGVLFLGWLLYETRMLILLLVLSVFFTYLIAPVVNLFESPLYLRGREVKLPRAVAILLVYFLLGVLLYISLQFLIPKLWDQVTQLATNLPDYVASASSSINKSIRDASSWMRHANLSRSVQDYLISETSHLAQAILPWLQARLLDILSYLQFVPWLILVPIISFFLLKDGSAFGERVVDLMPNEKLRKRVRWLLLDMSKTIAAYIRAQITACIVVSLQVIAGLAILGVDYAVLLGILAGILEFIPLAGPLIAALIIVGLTAIFSLKTALIVAIFLAVLRIVHDYIVYPRIIGEGIKMPPVLVIIAILAGAEVAGFLGIFLSIPVVGLILVGFHHYRAYRGIEKIRAESIEIETPTELSLNQPTSP